MKKLFLLVAFLAVMAAPAFADENLPAEDDLSATPIGCLVPSLSPVSTGGSPADAVASGANGVSGYLGDWGVYVSCLGHKLLITLNYYAQIAADKTASVIQGAQKPKQEQRSQPN